jgi:hypothetical protein
MEEIKTQNCVLTVKTGTGRMCDVLKPFGDRF